VAKEVHTLHELTVADAEPGGSPQHAHSVAISPSAWRAAGMPSASQQQVPVQVFPPASTRCGVGAKQKGFAIRISVEPAKRTSA
jgi:hypothetical protein